MITVKDLKDDLRNRAGEFISNNIWVAVHAYESLVGYKVLSVEWRRKDRETGKATTSVKVKTEKNEGYIHEIGSAIEMEEVFEEDKPDESVEAPEFERRE